MKDERSNIKLQIANYKLQNDDPAAIVLPTPGAHRGFTLVELLLVLALLTIIASLTALALRRPFANQRLDAAADMVRTQWCLARNEALRSGATYSFQFAVGGNSFRVQRCSDEPGDESRNWEAGSREQGAGSGASALLPAPSSPLPAHSGAAKFLPEHTLFDTMTWNSEIGSQRSEVRDQTSDLRPLTSAPGGWSDSIYFYPDGTTSDVRLVLVNDQGSLVELTLRGLTGAVAVSHVRAAGERLP
jgi:prepilin-type N-terminal cleavage/methylation domain-containing protein